MACPQDGRRFASAVVFVVAVNWMLDHLGEHSPHLPGWGLGGVGIGRDCRTRAAGTASAFNHRFAILFASCTLEGIGYIIAGAPLLRHGFQHALIAGALVVVAAALVAGLLQIPQTASER